MGIFPESEVNRLSAARLAISGMLALAVAIGVGRFAFTPILPMMQKDFGLTLRMAGLLASANYVGYFIGALSAIWIRAATVTVVRFSVVTVALLTGAMGLIHHPAAWLLLRGLAGMVSAWVLIFASGYILEQLATPDKRRHRGVVLGGVASGGVVFSGFGYIIPGTFLPAMAKQIIPDPAVFGWAWPIFGSTALVSTLMAGWLSAHLPNRRIWALSHGVMAIGVAMPVLLPGMAGIVISACCVGGTFMVATMTGMQEARILAPEYAPRLMAAMTAAFGIGQIFGPLLVSLVADWHNAMNVLLLGACALLLGSAVVLFRR